MLPTVIEESDLESEETLESEESLESIMKCDDFKSDFAIRLSNEYISNAPATRRQDTALLLPLNNTNLQSKMQPDLVSEKSGEFSLPVESIMRCEDFKSNFARRLSNRYITRAPATARKDTALKLVTKNTDLPSNAAERIEPCSQLSKNVTEQNGEVVKPPDKINRDSDMRNTEVSALNMEVETLRWQLSQTEANRQMHIALLRQIVSFLSRVKEHIECQKPEMEQLKETTQARLSQHSFNSADLPRSRSVVHVNKNLEYSLSPTKKISPKKMSKSICNVNGFRDSSGTWSPSKLSLTSESESSQKISEEMSRLINLANTVLSTKIPDLACTFNDIPDNISLNKKGSDDTDQQKDSAFLNVIEEDTAHTTNAFSLNTICDNEEVTFHAMNTNSVESKERTIKDFILSPLPLNRGLENDFADVKIIGEENITKTTDSMAKAQMLEKGNEYNNGVNFVEDESGFSSMSSFQEIGIPIISIIPPSPCKEVGYMGEITDILDESAKWKTESMDLEKAVKVFWV